MAKAVTAKPSLNSDLWPPTSRESWRDAPLQTFLTWLALQKVLDANRLRESSCDTYSGMFSAWINFLERGYLHVLEATPGDAERFFEEKKLEPISRRRYLQLLDRVYDYLKKKAGLVALNPIKQELSKEGLLDIALPLGLGVADIEQLQALLGDMPGWKGARDRGMAALMLGAGLRANELIDLPVTGVGEAYEIKVRPGGVHRAHTTLVLPEGPWRRWHQEWQTTRLEVAFPGELLCPATSTGKPYSPSGLFRRVSSWLDEVGSQATQRGPNVLRNTFAHQALASGRYSLEQVQEFLGHEELRATARHQASSGQVVVVVD